MAAPSPLSQSHPPPQSHDGDQDSENEEESSTPTKQVTSALKQLSLVQEVDVDLSQLHALSPEVISKQATINIGKSPILSLHPLLWKQRVLNKRTMLAICIGTIGHVA